NQTISFAGTPTIKEFRFDNWAFGTSRTLTFGSAADTAAGYSLTLQNIYRGEAGNYGTQTFGGKLIFSGDALWYTPSFGGSNSNGGFNSTGPIASNSAITLTKE